MKRIRRLIAKTAEAIGFYVGRLPPVADRLEHHLGTLLDHLDIDCVIDVGAHHGEFGLMLRRIGYAGRIVSFEPFAASFERLQEACRADAGWRAKPYALGARDGIGTFHVMEATDLNSFLDPSAYGREQFGDKLQQCSEQKVQIRRLGGVLDEVVEGLKAPQIFLKLDTQGYDLEVIAGLGERLDDIAALQCEVAVHPIYAQMPGFLDVIGRLNRLGFALSGLFPVTWDRDLRTIELDCVMVRAQGAASNESTKAFADTGANASARKP